MTKLILYKENARRALERGIDVLSNAVAVTIGPKGNNVVLANKFGIPQIINDGVTIAKGIELYDLVENTGVGLMRQAASKTNDIAGDGTTTSTVLAYSMVKQGLRNVAAGSNPIELKRGMEKASNFIVNKIAEYAEPIEDTLSIEQVAAVSAGNDSATGKLIADALERVGREGVIFLEEGHATSTTIEITEGMDLEKGFISPYFVTDNENMETVLTDAYVLITDKKITLVQQDLVPVLELVAKTNKPLLIIAEDIEKEALTTLIVNKLKGIVDVVAIRAPGFGNRRKDLLADLAILTNGEVISESAGLSLEAVSLSLLGQAKSILVRKDKTTIIADENAEKVRERCAQIRRQLEQADSAYDREKLQERLAKLGGGVAVIKVGAVTETELKDKKLRLEDAINATRAAVEEGIVPGGGTALAHLSSDLFKWASKTLKGDELIGALIVEKALTAPLRRIAENSGENGAVVVNKVKNNDFEIGYSAITNEYTDMYEAGIIDPAKVTRSAIQNAASIAAMVLTTECLIVNS